MHSVITEKIENEDTDHGDQESRRHRGKENVRDHDIRRLKKTIP